MRAASDTIWSNAGMDEVGELDLRHRKEPSQRHADRDAHDAGLGERGVDDPIRAEFVQPAGADPEHPTTVGDILTQQDHAVVGCHLVVQGITDRRDDVLLYRLIRRSCGLDAHGLVSLVEDVSERGLGERVGSLPRRGQRLVDLGLDLVVGAPARRRRP